MKTRNRRSTLVPFAVVLVACVTLSACGDSKRVEELEATIAALTGAVAPPDTDETSSTTEEDSDEAIRSGVAGFLRNWIDLYNRESWDEMWAHYDAKCKQHTEFMEFRDHLRGHRLREGDYRVDRVGEVLVSGDVASVGVLYSVPKVSVQQGTGILYVIRDADAWVLRGAKADIDGCFFVDNSLWP